MRVQASAIPSEESYGLNKAIVESQCQNVSVLLQHYLQCLGIESQALCGTTLAPGSMAHVPHVFLYIEGIEDIEGTIIDNNYIWGEDVNISPEENLDWFYPWRNDTLPLSSYHRAPPNMANLAKVYELAGLGDGVPLPKPVGLASSPLVGLT